MRHILSALIFAAMALAVPSQPQDSPPPTSLRECMDGMKREIQGMVPSLQSNQADPTLERIAALQSLVLRAKLESPPNLDDVPEADREAHRIGFRKELIGVLKELAEMEEHVLDGNFEKASESVMELLPIRERAHEKYQRKD